MNGGGEDAEKIVQFLVISFFRAVLLIFRRYFAGCVFYLFAKRYVKERLHLRELPR